MVISHSFDTVGMQKFSHSIGSALFTITDNTGTIVYGSTLFANTGSAVCPLPGVPVELTRGNGQVMKTTSASDGTFSFSISLGEPAQIRIPPYNGFSWASSYYKIAGVNSQRRLATTASTKTTTSFHSKNQVVTGVPTGDPSAMPRTSSPSLRHYSIAKMIHRFTFDHTLATDSSQVPDVISSNDFAAIHNGVTLSDSCAIFSKTTNPAAQPYLSLNPGWFGVADAISIEMWLSVDSNTQDNAVLYSFGDPTTPEAYLSLNAKGFQGFTNTYLVVVVDPSSAMMRIYVNGSSFLNQSISTLPLFDNKGPTEKFNSIGWDLKKTTPGFIGSFDEIRFWDGTLTASNISETAVLGVDPTVVSLSPNDTIYNIQIEYTVTSDVVAHVGFYGGLSHNRIFGSESVFSIQALDPLCHFNVTIALDPFYSANSVLLPAMNYSITLLPYIDPVPAPRFSNSLCSPSMDPYSYLTAADQLSVQIFSDLLNSSDLFATFVYHSGLCISISGAENFAISVPSPDREGRVCYNKNTTMLQSGQIWPLNITLFELYPSYTGNNPTWLSVKELLSLDVGSAVRDLVVLDATVEISDVVSGYNSPTTFEYSNVPYDKPSMNLVAAPPDLNYSISAASPLPSAPYALPFTIVATRNSPEGAVDVTYKAYIPILGTISSAVPNFYPVTTDPTLIFLILRDPPGGMSQTTISAGSTFTTGISIDGMQAFDMESHLETKDTFKFKSEQKMLEAPMGFGMGESAGNEDITVGGNVKIIAPDVTVSRTSETHYSYAFTFNYDFSTGDSAFTAGHPSDVIIGGGIDIIVSEALKGDRFYAYYPTSTHVIFSLRQLHH